MGPSRAYGSQDTSDEVMMTGALPKDNHPTADSWAHEDTDIVLIEATSGSELIDETNGARLHDLNVYGKHHAVIFVHTEKCSWRREATGSLYCPETAVIVMKDNHPFKTVIRTLHKKGAFYDMSKAPHRCVVRPSSIDVHGSDLND